MVSKKNLLSKTGIVIFIVSLLILSFSCYKEDFVGGSKWVLQVETDYAIKMQTLMELYPILVEMKDCNISLEVLSSPKSQTIDISCSAINNRNKISDILDDKLIWRYTFTDKNVKLSLEPNIQKDWKEISVLQTIETLKRRLGSFGLNEKYLEREDLESDRLVFRIPKKKRKDGERILKIISSLGSLSFKHVVTGPHPTEEEALEEFGGSLSFDLEMLRTDPKHTKSVYYVVKRFWIITGGHIANFKPSNDAFGSPAITFKLNDWGARSMRRYTSSNIGKRFSIVLNNRIISVLSINGVVSLDGQITGNFTVEEVKDLVLILDSGALPAPIKILEKTIIKSSEKKSE